MDSEYRKGWQIADPTRQLCVLEFGPSPRKRLLLAHPFKLQSFEARTKAPSRWLSKATAAGERSPGITLLGKWEWATQVKDLTWSILEQRLDSWSQALLTEPCD